MGLIDHRPAPIIIPSRLNATHSKYPPPCERRDSNNVNFQPASPEVISSLISALSTISTPTSDHFDIPPRISSTDADSFAYLDPVAETVRDGRVALILADEAAIPPIVPTSKSRSGSKRTSWASSVRSGYKRESTYVQDDSGAPMSIGNPSIEPGLRRSSASLRSSQSQRSLQLKSSKEKMREMDRERHRRPPKLKDTRGLPLLAPLRSAPVGARTSPRSPTFTLNQNRVPEAVLPSSLKVPIRATSLQIPIEPSPQTSGIAVTGDDGSLNMANGWHIPQRESSLRHSIGSAPSRRKRKSQRLEEIPPQGQPEENVQKEGEGVIPSTTALSGVSEADHEDEVTRRIKELKAQKELRDRSRADDTGDGEADRRPLKSTSLPAKLPTQQTPNEPRTSPLVPVSQSHVGDEHEIAPVRDEEIVPKHKTRDTQETPAAANSPPTDHVKSSQGISSAPPTTSLLPAPKSRSDVRKSSNSQRKISPQTRSAVREISKGDVSKPPHQSVPTSHFDDRPSTADSIDDEVEQYLNAARLSQKIHHPQTGRIISFSDVGDPNGSVVFCCVGMGLTRFLTAFYDELAETLKLRLITLDRPGVGESEPYIDGSDTPLGWPDDIRAVCQHLKITRFSILAHSAGAIYALATALRMPQHIRGRIHLLAPWIPPSQLSAIGTQQELPATSLPYSQRILRSLPTPFLRAANSGWFSVNSASITTSLPKSPRRSKRKSLNPEPVAVVSPSTTTGAIAALDRRDSGVAQRSISGRVQSPILLRGAAAAGRLSLLPRETMTGPATTSLPDKERQSEYDTRLTHSIWEHSTANANPAVDLLVCLERRQDIGFRYVDITKAVVIHHGSRDTRVPVENVKWLGKMMRRCEVRVLEGEGHGLMASAVVMADVLTEMAKEWNDWNTVVEGRRGGERRTVAR